MSPPPTLKLGMPQRNDRNDAKERRADYSSLQLEGLLLVLVNRSFDGEGAERKHCSENIDNDIFTLVQSVGVDIVSISCGGIYAWLLRHGLLV